MSRLQHSRPALAEAPQGDYPVDSYEASAPRMLVGTFHKTGTVLMRTILGKVARQLGYRFAQLGQATQPEGWRIYLHPHSAFPSEILAVPHRGVVVIRDPRDVIISGAHYHCRTDATLDRWLYMPVAHFRGRSYHEMIASKPNAEDRYFFEMDHSGRRTLARMAAFATPPPGFIHCRLEDLVADVELVEFRRIFTWLGMHPNHIPTALSIAEASSLFSRQVKNSHVRSGLRSEWRKIFTPAVHAGFRSRFGDLAERLGYPAA